MTDKSTLDAPTKSKRSGLPLVVAIFAAWTAGKTADAAVLPSLGYWGAFATGLVTAAVVAVVVSGLLNVLISRKNQ